MNQFQIESQNELQNKFMSQGNKRILWELMSENNIFNGIPDNYVNNVKGDFERTLKQSSGSIIDTDTILSLNKQVIIKMIVEVKKYTTIPVTAEEVLTKKQEKFQRGLVSKQEEFNNLIQPPKPPIIDFSEKLDDDPIGSEMDIKLAETIAWREKQLSQVLEKQDTTKANDWIKSGKQDLAMQTNVVKQSTHGDSIKIGDATSIDDIINVKKVSFTENTMQSQPMQSQPMQSQPMQSQPMQSQPMQSQPMQNQPIQLTFMDKLKKKDINDEIVSIKNDIKILLEQNKSIIENQDKLINLLISNK
jgi:hypothetical protein